MQCKKNEVTAHMYSPSLSSMLMVADEGWTVTPGLRALLTVRRATKLSRLSSTSVSSVMVIGTVLDCWVLEKVKGRFRIET